MSNRIHVPLKDFLRVTISKRDEFDTAEKAATELGYTSLESFKQALTRNRKRYPKVFNAVPKYTSSNGPHVATNDEVALLMAELEAETAEPDTAEAPTESAE
jgi:hypothetical protein